MLGQVVTQITYKDEIFIEEISYDSKITLSDYLNNQVKDSWLLHTIHRIDTNEQRIVYHCIWQKFQNFQQGIIP